MNYRRFCGRTCRVQRSRLHNFSPQVRYRAFSAAYLLLHRFKFGAKVPDSLQANTGSMRVSGGKAKTRKHFRCAVNGRGPEEFHAPGAAADENVRSSDGERHPVELPHP